MISAEHRAIIRSTVPLLEAGGEALTTHFYGILLDDHPAGTDYQVIVRHGDPAARARHEEIGFFDGWGSVTEQLVGLVEEEAAAARR